jgi:6-pyruvoyltetrahydropterin/6-carboxytetrahydropterin synthase
MIVRREYRFEASHTLPGHRGACRHLHGHSYRFQVSLEIPLDTETGMTMDFADIDKVVERVVLATVDHRHLNEIMPNPTAELIAVWIWQALQGELPGLAQIELWEVEGCSVVYRGEPERGS